jgi:hypothetical protein
LQGIQKVIYILAEEIESGQPNIGKILKTLTLRCKVPKEGSYAVPAEFGGSSSRLSEGVHSSIAAKVGCCLAKYIRAVSTNSHKQFTSIKNDSRRKQLLTYFHYFVPKGSDSWSLQISGKRYPQMVTFDSSAFGNLKSIQAKCLKQNRDYLQTVTGYLVAMDFAKQQITLRYPPTNTTLECFYQDNLEPELVESRRGLVQVTGMVTYNEDKETPKQISEVESIFILDQSDFVVKSFTTDSGKKVLKKPLILTPTLTESSQFMTAAKPEWGIDAIAQTREELWEEIQAEFRIQWEKCVLQPDEKLGKVMCAQKHALLAAVKKSNGRTNNG